MGIKRKTERLGGISVARPMLLVSLPLEGLHMAPGLCPELVRSQRPVMANSIEAPEALKPTFQLSLVYS
jgi:hypothetical protein